MTSCSGAFKPQAVLLGERMLAALQALEPAGRCVLL